MYPYTAGGTRLAASLPLWVQEGGREKMLERMKDAAVRERARREIEGTLDGWENFILAAGFDGIQIASVPPTADQSLLGKRISEIARARKQTEWEAFFAILLETEGRAGALYHMMSEEDVKTAMRWHGVSFGTDSSALRAEGLLARGSPHPRAYGNFARLLGKYVREERALSLPEAIRRLTSFPAANLRLRGRGSLAPGFFADVVVFDPATIADRSTFEQPHQLSVGVQHVFVNGVLAKDAETWTGKLGGRVVTPDRR